MLGGNLDRPSVDAAVLTKTTSCLIDIPGMISTRLASIAALAKVRDNGSNSTRPVVLFCGGRKDLLSIEADCWRLEQTEDVGSEVLWYPAASLPVEIAGAAASSIGSKVTIQ